MPAIRASGRLVPRVAHNEEYATLTEWLRVPQGAIRSDLRRQFSAVEGHCSQKAGAAATHSLGAPVACLRLIEDEDQFEALYWFLSKERWVSTCHFDYETTVPPDVV